MTRHGWRTKGKARTGLLALLVMLVVGVLPASALAFDSPVVPVSPAGADAEHGLGLIVTRSRPPAKALDAVEAGAADLRPAVGLDIVRRCPWATRARSTPAPPGPPTTARWATGEQAGHRPGALAPMFTYSPATGGKNVARRSRPHGHGQVAKASTSSRTTRRATTTSATQPTALQKANAQQWKLTSYDNLTITPNSGTVLSAGLDQGRAGRRQARRHRHAGLPELLQRQHDQSRPLLRPSRASTWASTPSRPSAMTRPACASRTSGARAGATPAGRRSAGPFVNKYVVEARAVGADGRSRPAAEARSPTRSSPASPPRRDADRDHGPLHGLARPSSTTSGSATRARTSPTSPARPARPTPPVAARRHLQGPASSSRRPTPTAPVTGTSLLAVGPIKPVAPTSTMAPAVTGTAARGQVLTTPRRAAGPTPRRSYTYAWQRR